MPGEKQEGGATYDQLLNDLNGLVDTLESRIKEFYQGVLPNDSRAARAFNLHKKYVVELNQNLGRGANPTSKDVMRNVIAKLESIIKRFDEGVIR
jgi:hypothetical protein